MWETDDPIQVKRIHRDVPTRLVVRAECQSRTVGRDPRRKGNRSEMSDGVLVGAVVVHRPDFLVARALADKVNLALGDAGNSAAQPEDDFIGELVGDDADSLSGGIVVVLLAEHLWRGRSALDIVKPALDGYFVGGYAQITEREHGSVGRGRSAPVGCFQFRRLSWNLQRVEALR